MCWQPTLVSARLTVEFPHSPCLTHITCPDEQIISRKLVRGSVSVKPSRQEPVMCRPGRKNATPVPRDLTINCLFALIVLCLNKQMDAPLGCVNYDTLSTHVAFS